MATCSVEQGLRQLWIQDPVLSAIIPADQVVPRGLSMDDRAPPYLVILPLGEVDVKRDDTGSQYEDNYRILCYVKTETDQDACRNQMAQVYNRVRFETDYGNVCFARITRSLKSRTAHGTRILDSTFQCRVTRDLPDLRFVAL